MIMKKVRKKTTMSNVKQIYSILNDVAKQTFGTSAIAVADTASFVSLGNTILKSDTDTENFLNKLTDRIAKTVYSVRNYSGVNKNMLRDNFEYGAIVQKIHVSMPEAKENKAWEIGTEGYTPTYAPVIKPQVSQKLFNKIATWEIDVTIPDYMLKTAFLNETSMATFIDAIFTAMNNAMQICHDNNANLIRANFIGNILHKNKSTQAINLLHDYNTLTNAGLTVANCMRDIDFLKYATMQINLWTKRMSVMSTLFNDDGNTKFTDKDNLVIDVLQDFASATATFLEADTYHKELVSLPMYNEVAYWQGSGQTFAFADTSKINVKIDAENTVEKSGIIAVAYDYLAIGTTINQPRTTTERNNKDEYTNYYNKANIGCFNDLGENGIVFYIAES